MAQALAQAVRLQAFRLGVLWPQGTLLTHTLVQTAMHSLAQVSVNMWQ